MPKILIADDNEEMLETLVRIFRLYEFETCTAANGKEAIEVAGKSAPDIIILDGMMPEMDGFEACKILKSNTNTMDIPIVFLTANFMEIRDRIKGIELGADDYLLKPFNSKELVTKIKSIIKRSEITQQLRLANQDLISKNEQIQHELNQLISGSPYNGTTPMDVNTGLLQFNYFTDKVALELNRAKRFNNALSLIKISCGHIISVKEQLGNQLFNYVVIKIANFILKYTRTIDLVSFDSSQGFFLLLPQTAFKGAQAKAEKILEALNKQAYMDTKLMNNMEISKRKMADISKVSFEFSVATYDEHSDAESFDSLAEKMDEMLT